MLLDVALRDYDLKSVPEFARCAETIGYDCIWTSETQHDPFLPLGVAATATSKIKLVTSIAVAFPRSPMITAYTAWDLQKASAGRFILGLGSQVRAHNQRRFSVKFESPGPKLREVVLALRAIWDCWQNGTHLRFKGKFYNFDLMTPFFNPGPIAHPTVPVFVAGVNRYMYRMAGEVCDGLHVHPFHTAKYLHEYVHPAVNEGLQTSGRSRRNFQYATSVFVIVGDTERERAENTEAIRQQIAFYASTRTYAPVLEAHGWEAISPELHQKSLDGDWKAMSRLITDEMIDEVAVSGTYEIIVQKLRQRYEGLLDRVSLYQPYELMVDEERLRKVVIKFN
ncbi:MAG: LLM class F420-dependent oxidoreductase [Acidobacteria bacterium]|nr:MAG: LLM class F420-dependent oxidoreductase [Acidobacteriota bacterium]PYV80096.1 MAG: LLM class F420-dependent oxidoreductase [Acidobacteriota bacterium]